MASADLSVSPCGDAETGLSPGEFVLKKLFAEFVVVSDRKLQHIATQPLVSIISYRLSTDSLYARTYCCVLCTGSRTSCTV